MTVHVIAVRGPGIREGEPIIDPLIGDIPTALSRGRNELDAAAEGLQPVDLESIYSPGMELGQLAKVDDFETPRVLRGKVVRISHRIAGPQVTTEARLQQPTDIGVS